MNRRSLCFLFRPHFALFLAPAALAALLALSACGPDTASNPANNSGWGDGDNQGDGSSGSDSGDVDDENPCSHPSSNSCHELATCRPTTDAYECFCGPDFTGDGTLCEYIDAPCNVSYIIADRGEADDFFSWDLQVPGDCATIQEALDAAARTAATGEGAITVQPGIYSENLDFGGAAVTLRSLEGPEVTTIDGSAHSASTISFTSSESSRSVLEGFTITGGSGTFIGESGYGGGVHIHQASPILRDLILRENATTVETSATFYGGGIALRSSSATLERIHFLDNVSTYYGGGLYVSQSNNAELRNLLFAGNESLYGGGLVLYYSDTTLENALFLDNTGSFGAAIMLQGNAPSITQATLHGNQGNGIYVYDSTPRISNSTISNSTGHGIENDGGSPDVHFSNFWNNAGGIATGMDTPSAEMDNLFVDPRFQSVASLDWSAWDLTLRPDSLLLGAADPALENPDGSPGDIGAYGGPRGASW